MAETRFRGLDSLEQKYFTYDEKTGNGLSVYIWSSLEKATQCFSSQFAAEFEKVFNTTPAVRYLGTLMVIDNVADKVSFY